MAIDIVVLAMTVAVIWKRNITTKDTGVSNMFLIYFNISVEVVKKSRKNFTFIITTFAS